jgi:NAD(P)-dependent dehydrogenase (short-subunit alcohol dehydrogenase family)
MQLAGTSAFVTGGASGLGLATVQTLRARGARVVIVDLPSSNGKALAEDFGDSVLFAPADVCDPDEVSSALDVATSAKAPLRVVVNCAGIGAPALTLGKRGPMALDFFTRMVAVNLTGTFNVIRLAAERMAATDEAEGERGVVINTASIAALDGPQAMVAYTAAKSGVIGMTLPLARDLASLKIRVVTIAPGAFDTAMFQALPDLGRSISIAEALHPTRVGDPAEFAALVAHVVENPMLNGETIRVDAGARVGMTTPARN